MPTFGSQPAPGLYPGDNFILSNASLGGANLTQSVAPAQLGGNPANLTVINKTAATLTVEVSQTNVAADFEPLSGGLVGPDSALSFSTTAAFVAVLPSADPGAATITIAR